MPPTGAACLLLHIGFGRQSEMAVAQADDFAAAVEVVAPCLDGLGDAPLPAVVPDGCGAGRAFAGECPQFFDAVQGDDVVHGLASYDDAQPQAEDEGCEDGVDG